MPVKSIWAAFVALLLAATAAQAERAKSSPDKSNVRDSAAIQDCIKSAAEPRQMERCIGIVADPCTDRDDAKSTADQVACAAREHAVWDDILNETFRRLRDKLDAKQKIKLRDMQRAWVDSRDRTCAFYWDHFQGTIASPMSAFCNNRETARRALFLLGFLNDAEGT
jgi:uncharacterized protein YecT (DUF1311 family)